MIKEQLDIKHWNAELRGKSPEEIIEWALRLTEKRIVTTSFGKYSAVLLSTFYKKEKNIEVIWCDTGYNIPETYSHASQLIEKFRLNVYTYVPLQTKAFTEFTLGEPDLEQTDHKKFTEIVKLEPFRRAIETHQPEVWFTNIRIRQTELRNSKDILSYSKDGILKVSPFYYWTDEELDKYLEENNLSKNSTYYDPVKALEGRECGIHLQ
ncbi:phosphoadenosine phosphosulfate reductase domain-containing protein [Tenacibaculum aquimarinum]|uniref:phosphoadenosine phosphosulfate reductase domain-containing protein n=1 Tax=Tenacibaculum aquimarinum TaxID=2910675 RepID=UPI001F0A7A34|nr:phosphoadenosine phosphosulfate reductase family protein [Tenacibaculum aquimarinum]MCH3881791.1 phosphoadenosine phosphosulfate reductase family protein [Tenacibaculum aquimarinum]